MTKQWEGAYGVPFCFTTPATITLREGSISLDCEDPRFALNMEPFSKTITKYCSGFLRSHDGTVVIRGMWVSDAGSPDDTVSYVPTPKYIIYYAESNGEFFLAKPWSSRPLPSSKVQFASEFGVWHNFDYEGVGRCLLSYGLGGPDGPGHIIWFRKDEKDPSRIYNPDDFSEVFES